jgi:hypothetical protein
VSNVVRSGCGYVLEGDEAEDLLADAERHVRIAHAELLGTLSPLELARPLEADEAAAA